METTKAEYLAGTILDDLRSLLTASLTPEHDEFGIAKALKENINKITCFGDLHDYMDANTLGDSEKIWEELTDDIGLEGDEMKIQAACDVVNEAQSLVDDWIKHGGLRVSEDRAHDESIGRT